MTQSATHMLSALQTNPLNKKGNSAAAPESVVRAVQEASQKVGVSFSYLMTKAATESSFNPNARAKSSSAAGLYQFIESTWLDMVKKHGADYGLGDMASKITRTSAGKLVVTDKAAKQDILALRNDPKMSALMAAEYAGENKAILEKSLGREATDTDLYLAHFLGAGGACKFLKAMSGDADCSAAAILPTAASANPAIFYSKSTGEAKSLQDIYAHFAKKFEGSGAGSDMPTGTVGTAYAQADSVPATKTGEATAQIALAALDDVRGQINQERATSMRMAQRSTLPAARSGAISMDTALLLSSLEVPKSAEWSGNRVLAYPSVTAGAAASQQTSLPGSLFRAQA
jgi:hypothetical protein